MGTTPFKTRDQNVNSKDCNHGKIPIRSQIQPKWTNSQTYFNQICIKPYLYDWIPTKLTPPWPLPNHHPPDWPLNHLFTESIRSTQWEIQHYKQYIKHWFFATRVAGAGKGNFQLPDTATVSPFLISNHQQQYRLQTLLPLSLLSWMHLLWLQ